MREPESVENDRPVNDGPKRGLVRLCRYAGPVQLARVIPTLAILQKEFPMERVRIFKMSPELSILLSIQKPRWRFLLQSHSERELFRSRDEVSVEEQGNQLAAPIEDPAVLRALFAERHSTTENAADCTEGLRLILPPKPNHENYKKDG